MIIMSMKVEFEWREDIPEEIEKPILALTGNGKMLVFKNTSYYGKSESCYKRLKEKYNVRCWAYQEELIKKLA